MIQALVAHFFFIPRSNQLVSCLHGRLSLIAVTPGWAAEMMVAVVLEQDTWLVFLNVDTNKPRGQRNVCVPKPVNLMPDKIPLRYV